MRRIPTQTKVSSKVSWTVQVRYLCHCRRPPTTSIVQRRYVQDSQNSHKSEWSIIHCCWAASLVQFTSPSTWFRTCALGFPPAAEDACYTLRMIISKSLGPFSPRPGSTRPMWGVALSKWPAKQVQVRQMTYMSSSSDRRQCVDRCHGNLLLTRPPCHVIRYYSNEERPVIGRSSQCAGPATLQVSSDVHKICSISSKNSQHQRTVNDFTLYFSTASGLAESACQL